MPKPGFLDKNKHYQNADRELHSEARSGRNKSQRHWLVRKNNLASEDDGDMMDDISNDPDIRNQKKNDNH